MDPTTETERRRRFESTVESVHGPLRRYLLRRVDLATAEDVLGDVLLVMWRRADDIPADAPLAWCYGVTRGCLANTRRQMERRLRLVRRLADVPPPPETSSEDHDLDAALDALDARDREILRLWAWEDLPPRDIAVVLGTTPNAASIRLHRATTRLRAEYALRTNTDAPEQAAKRHEEEAPR